MSRTLQNLPDPEIHPCLAARVRSTKPYDPVSSLQAIKGSPQTEHFKLDWNESSIAPSPRVFEALRRYLNGDSRINWYPDACNRELIQKIADYAGCPPEQILVTSGSDEALAVACQTFLDPGDGVVAPFPTYKHFLLFAELAGAGLNLIRKPDPFALRLADVAAAIDGRTKIVYLANPNNPTGTLFEPSAIGRLAASHPQVLFLVDEAYYEFCGSSCTGLLGRVANLMVTRSFSKCFGLAGLRLGYAAAPEWIIANLQRVHNPKNINTVAQIAAAAALDDLGYYRDYADQIRLAAALTRRFCDENGIGCRLSHTNFVLIQVQDPAWTAARLREAGVHVRDRSAQLPGMIRITLGTADQMREVLRRLKRVLDVRPPPALRPQAVRRQTSP